MQLNGWNEAMDFKTNFENDNIIFGYRYVRRFAEHATLKACSFVRL
jgi:hypothetical protein